MTTYHIEIYVKGEKLPRVYRGIKAGDWWIGGYVLDIEEEEPIAKKNITKLTIREEDDEPKP